MKDAQVAALFQRFAEAKPDPRGELEYKNPYTLLVAVVLSAQATDAGVNKATKPLFKVADSPAKMLALGERGLREHIKTIGLYNSKAKNVIKLSEILEKQYSGKVPNSREALEQLKRNSEPHPCHGIKMRFVNPVTGGYTMPTIGAFMQLLPAGFSGAAYRQTDATIFVVVEGQGRTRIGDQTYDWRPRDIFVAPSWAPIAHEAQNDAIVFSLSDRPAQQALGLWREQVPVE